MTDQNLLKEPSGFIIMPLNINVYNANNERCDMAEGPCSCGAWHHIIDWNNDIRNQINNIAD